MSRLTVTGVLMAAFITMTTPAPAGAQYTHDKLAFLTFSGSVQVPGATLNAGTYRFRLTNETTSRNVIQVLSEDAGTVYSMFNTIPDTRSKLTDEATVTFIETPAGVPPAVHSLFYGGEYGGYEFVYGKGEPNMTPPPEPVQPPITFTPPAAAIAPLPVEEAVPEAPPAPAEETPAPAELPKTASPLPFLALGGLSSLLAGLGLRRRR